jgi:hypothetical protein
MITIPVLVEPLVDRPGCTARTGEPFQLSVEAASAEEAVRQLTALVQQRLQTGASVWTIPVPGQASPQVTGGWLPDDDLTREWLQTIQDYRQECDEADQRRILGEEGKRAS